MIVKNDALLEVKARDQGPPLFEEESCAAFGDDYAHDRSIRAREAVD